MDPITESRSLTCTSAGAFTAFTVRVGEWWPPSYSPDPDTLDTVVIEPMIGGRVFMRMVDGTEHDFGEVTSWRPGDMYAQTWTMAQDPDHPSSLTVTLPRQGTVVRCASSTVAGTTASTPTGTSSVTGR